MNIRLRKFNKIISTIKFYRIWVTQNGKFTDIKKIINFVLFYLNNRANVSWLSLLAWGWVWALEEVGVDGMGSGFGEATDGEGGARDGEGELRLEFAFILSKR